MARVQLFLSTVSAEFLSYLERLRHLLTRPDVEVKVQEDFIVTGDETLEMLNTYIQGCDGVDVTPMSGPVSMRAGGVIKPPSIAGGLLEAYAPGEPSAVCMCCTPSCAVLPITLLPVTIQKAQYSKIHP